MTREQLYRDHPEYSRCACEFIERVVPYTVRKLGELRHVSALELLKGVRELGQEEFGDLAFLVFQEWGMAAASDVGKIVYLLIEYGALSASDDDDPGDFNIEFALADRPHPAPDNIRALEKIA